MTKLVLFRGIAVPSSDADRVMDRIRFSGLRGDEGRWSFAVPEMRAVREQLDALFAFPGLTAERIFEGTPFQGICACGNRRSAEFYAARHNLSEEHDQAIVIEFEAPLDRVYVDPRDFLCTVFQMWDAQSPSRQALQRRVLRELYGLGVVRYFDAACETADQRRRIAMCNLAGFDPDVVLAHHRNTCVINGRHGTLFTSAFFVQAPVAPEAILDVHRVPTFKPPRPDVLLHEVIRGSNASSRQEVDGCG